MSTAPYITVRFPTAKRVSLNLLRDKYAFTDIQIDEIKEHWIVDHRDANIYCKPYSTFHKELDYLKHVDSTTQNSQDTGVNSEES
tara:strand:+ start:430 stop:684 length:255 start_codon:yes stop_codon:yes gene_type:complete